MGKNRWMIPCGRFLTIVRRKLFSKVSIELVFRKHARSAFCVIWVWIELAFFAFLFIKKSARFYLETLRALFGMSVSEGFTVMKFGMVGLRHHDKVTEGVIQCVSIDMVNYFRPPKRTTNVTFYDPSVLKKRNSIRADRSVSPPDMACSVRGYFADKGISIPLPSSVMKIAKSLAVVIRGFAFLDSTSFHSENISYDALEVQL